MHVDNLCKYLADRHPASFAAWLLGTPIPRLGRVEILQTELSSEPIRADQATFIRDRGRILHLEFQLDARTSDPALPLRMLDYWVRLHRRHRVPVDQVVVLLKRTSSKVPDYFQHEHTSHRFRVVKLWEEDAGPLLADPALLPLATLARADDRRQLISAVATQVRKIEGVDLRREISSMAQVVAGLAMNQEVISAMFNDELLKESSVYQWIVKEGLAEGRAQGIAEGRAEGIAQGIAQGRHDEAVNLLAAILNARFGPLPEGLRDQLAGAPTPVLEHLSAVAATAATVGEFTEALVASANEAKSNAEKQP